MYSKIKIIFLTLILVIPHTLYAKIDYSKIVKDIKIEGYKNLSSVDRPQLSELKTRVGRKIIKNDINRDLNYLFLTGYFQEVSAKTVPDKSGVTLKITIKENPVIQNIVVLGNTIFSKKDCLKELLNQPHHVLNIKYIEEEKQKLTRLYHQKGYTLFKVKNIEINNNQTLTYTLTEGKITEVHFNGLKNIKPFIAERNLILKTNELFNSTWLPEDRRYLLTLGYFSDVQLKKVQNNINDDISLTYQVKERKSNLIDVGIEQEEEEIVGFIRSDINHTLIHSDLISGKIQFGYNNTNKNTYVRSYALKYVQPWLFNLFPISFATDIWTEIKREFLTKERFNRSDRTLYENKRRGADVIFGLPLIKNTLTFSTKFNYENISSLEPTTNISYDIRSISGILSYSTVRNNNNPKHGTYWTVKLENGGDFSYFDLGGLDFKRANIDFATFLSLNKKSVLALHTFMGIFEKKQTKIDTFDSEGYEIGGPMSLRGYHEYIANLPFRGLRKILFNIEYRYDLSPSFQGVLFCDIGKTFNEGWNYSLDTFEKGYGTGLRYFTPVGPLRLDFSWGDHFIVHFSIGQLF